MGDGPADGLTIAGNPTRLWGYAWYGMLLALVIAAISDVVLAVQGNAQWYNLVAAIVLTPAIFGLVFGGVCLSWKARVLPVSYRATIEGITLLRSEVEVVHYPRANILAADVVGVMDFRAIVTRLTYNPSWPHLRLEVMHGPSRERIDLPEILIWGRDEVREAESAIRQALQL